MTFLRQIWTFLLVYGSCARWADQMGLLSRNSAQITFLDYSTLLSLQQCRSLFCSPICSCCFWWRMRQVIEFDRDQCRLSTLSLSLCMAIQKDNKDFELISYSNKLAGVLLTVSRLYCGILRNSLCLQQGLPLPAGVTFFGLDLLFSRPGVFLPTIWK